MNHDEDIEQCAGTTRTPEAIKMMHFSSTTHAPGASFFRERFRVPISAQQ